ncbi:hypothetical protein MESS2_730222 [Mesorhizobium metallidurans STM 2683]|uniref:Uncharacterized protein n=1 Tax=Mesorhizobium metallidurans STM 2683 TaxID=1297569 RepID=M5F8U6_9HYPH|nr:hypothetical protein MESS2_730222 [Mesorhizobium metallidurans STM 2683]
MNGSFPITSRFALLDPQPPTARKPLPSVIANVSFAHLPGVLENRRVPGQRPQALWIIERAQAIEHVRHRTLNDAIGRNIKLNYRASKRGSMVLLLCAWCFAKLICCLTRQIRAFR